MQSKTSCCNRAVIRKDLTRFAPVWGLYTLCLLMGIFLLEDAEYRFYRFAYDLSRLPGTMAFVNCGYALLTAQLLFGDLYNTRSCYALHAMPLRRESWFLSHVISGLLMSLAPTFVMALFATALGAGGAVENQWMMPWLVFGAANLQYLFFFGLAALCAFAAGNRLGMIACYGVGNFLSVAVSYVIDSMYIPMLYGVVYSHGWSLTYCPVAKMGDITLLEIPDFGDLLNAWEIADRGYDLHMTFTLGQGWGYTVLCAVIGVGLLALALVLYRRRKLECAGDLLAVKALEPVFLVLAALGCGYAFQMVFFDIRGLRYNGAGEQIDVVRYLGGQGWLAFMAIGLTVGWFAARMLLYRTTRVFRKKAVPGLVVLMALVALSFAGAAMDPLGLETWQPATDEIASIAFAYDPYYDGAVMDQPGDRENLMKLHRMVIENPVTEEALRDNEEGHSTDRFALIYKLKNGRTVKRQYMFWMDTPTAELAKSFFTRPELILGGYDGQFDVSKIKSLDIWGERESKIFHDPAVIASFVEAVRADCAAGTMAHGYLYHRNTGYFVNPSNDKSYEDAIRIDMDDGPNYLYVPVYPDSENCLKWLEDNGIMEIIDYIRVDGDYFDYMEYINNQYADESVG